MEYSSQLIGQEVSNSVACLVKVVDTKILPPPGIEAPSSKSFEQTVLAPTVQYNIHRRYEQTTFGCDTVSSSQFINRR